MDWRHRKNKDLRGKWRIQIRRDLEKEKGRDKVLESERENET